MKNFVRALRFSWPYRGRLFISILCALLAAVFWSLNFTAITPVLTILTDQINLQEWIDKKIADTEKVIYETEPLVEARSKAYKKLENETGDFRDKRCRDLAHELAKLENRLETARTSLSRCQLAKKYIDQYVPTDPFQTLAWLIGALVISVAIKGFFDFWQDSLVGSVVNLSLFDLRNRFYRTVIHLDVDQFTEHGSSELMARFTNDMEMLGNGTKTLFGKMVAEPLRALGCVILACFINWQLTLMFMVLVPIAIIILTKVGRTMKRATPSEYSHDEMGTSCSQCVRRNPPGRSSCSTITPFDTTW